MYSMDEKSWNKATITKIKSWDVRFPTSQDGHGSDAVHGSVDYSCVYVQIRIDSSFTEVGCGLTFTIGRGNEVVKTCVDQLTFKLIGKKLVSIFNKFGEFAHDLCNDNQMRWLGPDCGVLSLACCALLNGLWDLWAKLEKKPLWLLLCEMPPELIIKCGIWKYVEDELTREEALHILSGQSPSMVRERMLQVQTEGLRAYTTTCGWLGYSDQLVKEKLEKCLNEGWTSFKIKVGSNLEDDKRRCQMVRETIGPDNILMIDANQKWAVKEAIDWVKELAPFGIYWIEEPTAPDDILGHEKVRLSLKEHGVRVATGEVCRNRVMFKQFCSRRAFDICQIDCGRVASVNELIPILLLARKFNVTVCPHGGGVGLCEMIQHVAAFNIVRVAEETNECFVEHADHLSQHFKYPFNCPSGFYNLPTTNMGPDVGYSTTMKDEAIIQYSISMSEFS